MNYTLLQRAKKALIEAQEDLILAEQLAVKEKGDNMAWKKIQEELDL